MMMGDKMRKSMMTRDGQKGAATLLVSMVLMVAATLLVLYVSNTVVGEQKMSANEVRSKQAFEGAQAGIELAIERANAGNNFEAASETALNAAWDSANSGYRVIFCDASVFPAAQTCPDAVGDITRVCLAPQPDPGPDAVAGTADDVPATIAWAVGCGWSDDSAARKRIIAMVAKGTPLPANITNPLTAKGAVFFNGNSTVVNYFNNLTVWTGNNLDNTGNTGKTVIRRPSTPAGALTSTQVDSQVGDGNQVCNAAQAPALICTTSSGVFGPDVIQSDQNLSTLTEDQFFENFLGLPPADYKNTMAEKVVAGADAGSITEGGKVYWVEGNATIDQNIGTLAEPVVLVVDGDLTVNGNPTIYGVVFVRGDLTTSGTPKVRGAMVASGNVDSGGTMNIIYDPEAISNAGNVTGTYATVAGTWRDF